MSFFITEAETEALLANEVRTLPMLDGNTRHFSAFMFVWKAFDFLIVCGRWSKSEIVALALQLQNDPHTSLAGISPKNSGQPGPVSMLEIKMLEGPRVDPAMIQPVTTAESGAALRLDECLHNVVAALYADLQDRLD